MTRPKKTISYAAILRDVTPNAHNEPNVGEKSNGHLIYIYSDS